MLCTNPLTGATHLHWVPRTNGWHVELAGAGVQGTVEWSGPAPGRLVARLDHVALVPAETPELAHSAEQAEAVAAKPGGTNPPLSNLYAPRSDERRVGKACVSSFNTRCSPVL